MTKPNSNTLMRLIAAETILNSAYDWLRKRRLESHANNDFWRLSLRWAQVRTQIRDRLLRGIYTLSPVELITLANGHSVSQWCAEDAIVLKALALVLTPTLCRNTNLSRATHLKGNGGLKGAVNKAYAFTQKHRFVFKTDIANYYESISHRKMHDMLCDRIQDKSVQRLLFQVMNRVHLRGGAHRLINNKSIPAGCPLSPLFAALYLHTIDDFARRHTLAYVRYMDDFVFFVNSRHRLRRVIKAVYRLTAELQLQLSQPKTWIGRTSKGFDFLGYRLHPRALSMARQTLDRFFEKCAQLYEQGRPLADLRAYITRWIQWACAAVTIERKTIRALLLNHLWPPTEEGAG